jgi:pentatricopeptide repeat protein
VTVDSSPSSLWEKSSQRLLDSSDPWTAGMRHEATQAITHWCGGSSPENAFHLLDRLILQEMSSTMSASSGEEDLKDDIGIDTVEEEMANLVNLVVLAWQRQDESTVEPTEVLERLERYRNEYTPNVCNIQTYTMVLNVEIQRGHPAGAARLADELRTKCEQDDKLIPDEIFYSNIIMAHAKSGGAKAAARSQELLEELKASNLASNSAYVGVITAWANSGHPEAPQMAEALLEEMHQSPNLEANTKAFGAVLNAWAKSSAPNAPQRAMVIWQTMQEQNVEANHIVYTTIMDTFAKQGKAAEAEQMLQELLDKYEATQEEAFAPSVVAFSVVINAWSRSRHPNAAVLAEAALDRMQKLAETNPSLQPNVVTFNSVLHAWANSRHPKAPERAEQILNTLQKLYEESSNPALKPNQMSVSTVITCWAKSRDPRAPFRAEAILDHLCKIYEDGNEEMKPDTFCFASVMSAYSKSRPARRGQVPDVDVTQKVEGLLKRMNNSGLRPSTHVYGTLIHAWVRHADSPDKAVRRAEEIFKEVHEVYEGGNLDCKPHVILYNSLIDAYAKAGDGQKAQALLDDMEHIPEIEPTIVTYNSVLAAWAQSSDEQSLDLIDALFDRIRKSPKYRPDSASFGAAMSAFNRSSSPNAAERALDYVDECNREYKSGNERCKPSVKTYGMFLLALSRSRFDRENAAKRVVNILTEMKKANIMMNGGHYRSALECVSRAKDRASAAFSILKEMEENHIAPNKIHLDLVLQTCAWNKSSGELRNEALGIAKRVFPRIQNPSARTYENMIWVAGRGSDRKFVEQLCRECQQKGFDSDAKIREAVTRCLQS